MLIMLSRIFKPKCQIIAISTIFLFGHLITLRAFAFLPIMVENASFNPTEIVLPIYPQLALRGSVQGTVECEVEIVRGKISKIVAISGHDLLKGAVEYSIREWVYSPGFTGRTRLLFIFHLVPDYEVLTRCAKINLPEVHIYTHRLPAELMAGSNVQKNASGSKVSIR
jgi:hypothetical protein